MSKFSIVVFDDEQELFIVNNIEGEDLPQYVDMLGDDISDEQNFGLYNFPINLSQAITMSLVYEGE